MGTAKISQNKLLFFLGIIILSCSEQNSDDSLIDYRIACNPMRLMALIPLTHWIGSTL